MEHFGRGLKMRIKILFGLSHEILRLRSDYKEDTFLFWRRDSYGKEDKSIFDSSIR